MIKLHTKRKKIQRTTKSFALEILLLIEETVCFRIMKKKPLVFFPARKETPRISSKVFPNGNRVLVSPLRKGKKEECGNLILVSPLVRLVTQHYQTLFCVWNRVSNVWVRFISKLVRRMSFSSSAGGPRMDSSWEHFAMDWLGLWVAPRIFHFYSRQ